MGGWVGGWLTVVYVDSRIHSFMVDVHLLIHSLIYSLATGEEEEEAEEKVWVGVLGQAVLEVKQTKASTLYRLVRGGGGGGGGDRGGKKKKEEEELRARLLDYFQVETSLAPLYARWGKDDLRMKSVAQYLPGVRVVRSVHPPTHSPTHPPIYRLPSAHRPKPLCCSQ